MVPLHMSGRTVLRALHHRQSSLKTLSVCSKAVASAATQLRVAAPAADPIRVEDAVTWMPREVEPLGAAQAILTEMSQRVLEGAEDPFFVVDLDDVQSRVSLWRECLPDVEPFYAVKCNPDSELLSLLASNGVNFDCASQREMQQVLDLQVEPSRIVYANPCKQPSHIRFAAAKGVGLSVFDSDSELRKIAVGHPGSDLLIRIQVDDSKAQCVMSDKYGAPPADVPRLLGLARELGLNVRGVSFHVGSGCYSANAFVDAVTAASCVHRIAADAGAPMDILDIGGGFPGVDTPQLSFATIAASLRPALAQYFPRSSGVRVIAEPGRFFAATSHTLAVNIIGKKCVTRPDGAPHTMYYVNDGLYGSFNCVVYDHADPEYRVLPDVRVGAKESEGAQSSSVWGPTCDGFDCIIKETQLPHLDVGRWLYFPDMGAYTSAAGSTFNGMPLPGKLYFERTPLSPPAPPVLPSPPWSSSPVFALADAPTAGHAATPEAEAVGSSAIAAPPPVAPPSVCAYA